jgi:peptidoglycan L-alanyl-D-glutamate endopeptidase CwlK
MYKKTKAFLPAAMYPRFLQKLERLGEALEARGAPYWLTSGLRSWEDQEKLYALGRTVANVDATEEKPMGGKVTNARGGQSYHNFAIAADWALDKDTSREGLQPDWNFESYRVLAEEATKLGLEAGFYWKSFPDAPHVQLPLSKVGLKLLDLQTWYSKGGMPLVWANLDKYNW